MNARIPHGCYWTTPFAKWQESFTNLRAMRFAAHVTKAELQKRANPMEPLSVANNLMQWRDKCMQTTCALDKSTQNLA